MAPPKLYVAYTGNSVGIDPSFGRGPTKELALETVGDLIEASAIDPIRQLLGLPKDHGSLSLYLPGDVGLKSLDLAKGAQLLGHIPLKALIDEKIAMAPADCSPPNSLVIKIAAGKVSWMRDLIR
jgi:hypothetical protein